ncbi:MAG: FecR family protein [Candidatus Omnitrophica bacterium]|jgi:hypothetical protein|nr:FecR family protein [Candidatus Omnitrophota bacterium]
MRQRLWIFAVSVLCFFCACSSAFSESDISVIYVKGVVNIQKADDAKWQIATRGMALDEKDRIKTLDGSEVSIALDTSNKNIVTLSQNSEISIADAKKKHLSLYNGRIFALIEGVESASSFQVRTPTAVAGVSGSGMSVESDGNNTTVGCFEDMAYVQGINEDGTLMAEIVIIDNGFKRVIGRFEMPGDLIMLSDFDREGWSQFRQNLKEYLSWLGDKREQGLQGAADAMDAIQGMQERLNDIRDDNKENIFERDEHQKRDDERDNKDRPSDGGGDGRPSYTTGIGV